MTLNMFIVAPHGMWLCSDFGVTDVFPPSTKYPRGIEKFRKSCWTPKYVVIRTSDDATICLTYTGIAELRLGDRRNRRLSTAKWLVQSLSEFQGTAESVVERIRSKAERVRELRKHVHLFTGFAIAGSRGSWLLQIRNADVRSGDNSEHQAWLRPPLPRYESLVTRIDDPPAYGFGALGSGAVLISEESRTLLRRVRRYPPKNPEDYMNVLAKINSQVGGMSRSGVSRSCQVLYFRTSPAGRGPMFISQLYRNGEVPPSEFLPAVYMVDRGVEVLSASEKLFGDMAALSIRVSTVDTFSDEYGVRLRWTGHPLPGD